MCNVLESHTFLHIFTALKVDNIKDTQHHHSVPVQGILILKWLLSRPKVNGMENIKLTLKDGLPVARIYPIRDRAE